jgi:hypothetical protein
VFPVNGKVPAVPKGTSQFDYRCPRAKAATFTNYGVPLGQCRAGWIVVVDTDNPGAESWVSAHLPDTPFQVRTKRGRHRYFRSYGRLPAFIYRDGHTIENKGKGFYVIGPGSLHPSGVTYTADEWSWRWDDLPYFPSDLLFDDRPPDQRGSSEGEPYKIPPLIASGEGRHHQMFLLMRALAARGVPLDGALKICRAENKSRCRPPLDATELDEYLTRMHNHRDRESFTRTPQTGWVLAAGLLTIGLTVEATIAGVRTVDPTFDPEAVA